MSWVKQSLFTLGLLSAFPVQGFADNSSMTFEEWTENFRAEAVENGISAQTLDIAFSHLSLLPVVITSDRKQPEFRKDFQSYIDNAINNLRIRKCKKMMKEHAELLAEIQKKYGVPAEYLISFWAMETNFGTQKGDHSIINALSTLAYDTRRSDFFRSELMHAMNMVQNGVSPLKMKGSWAGAFGNFQFMPSTYHNFAVDYDNDGDPDLWDSFPDAVASAANYLSSEGWKSSFGWGTEVFLPKRFNWNLIEKKKTLKEWQAEGIRFTNKKSLPSLTTTAELFVPAGIQGPAFLVYSNFRVILKWNNSVLYAISVGHLADRIQDKPPFTKKYARKGKPFTLENSMEVQELLKKLKLYHGETDGILGRKSREAVRRFQSMYDLPADGYASPSLLHFMRLVLSGGVEKKGLTFDEVIELQKILSRGNYYKGPIDGKMGLSTEKAVQLYKKVYGLKSTSINRKLLEKMRVQSERNLEEDEIDPEVEAFWKQEDIRKKEEQRLLAEKRKALKAKRDALKQTKTERLKRANSIKNKDLETKSKPLKQTNKTTTTKVLKKS